MKTLTVRLPEALAAEIESESRRRTLSKSEWCASGWWRLGSRADVNRRPSGAVPLNSSYLVDSFSLSLLLSTNEGLQTTNDALDCVVLCTLH